jgi:hypothetical protein
MGVFQGGPEVNERIVVRTSADIAAIERGGLDAFLQSATPFVHVGNAECQETARRALVGMPIPYEVRLDSRVLPEIPQ